MIGHVAIGLAGTVGILLLGKPLDWLLRERPGRWIAPEAWIPLLIVWNVAVSAFVASEYEYALTADIGAQSGELRKTATIGGVPLIALTGLTVFARRRLIRERRRIPILWALGVMMVVAALGVGIGFASDHAPRYIASDTWRWVVLPLYGVLAAGEERPRAWPLVLAPAAIGAFTVVTGAYSVLEGIGDAVRPGPISTLVFVGTAVAVGWAARCHRRVLAPLALLLVLEAVVTASSAARTAAILAGIAVVGGILLARRPVAIGLAMLAVGIPTLALALAIIKLDPVREWARPSLDRWELRAGQELIPRGAPDVPVPAPEPDAYLPGPRELATVQAVPVKDPEPEIPNPYPSFSSVGERREEVERSMDWLLRGSPPVDAFRLVFGLGQGVQYLAPQLPPLDAHTKLGYRHHIHVTYVSVLVRNGAVGLLALLATLALMLLIAVDGIRRLEPASVEGLAARVLLVATGVFALEMVTGFVFIGTFEGGVLVAGTVALGAARWERERQHSVPT